jgi:hypothetical protein
MKKLLPLFIFIFAVTVAGQVRATTEDGKKVILKSDGTWEHVVEKPDSPRVSTPDDKTPISNYNALVKFAQINEEQLKKSEFETEEQYLARLEKYVNETEFENKKLSESSLLMPSVEFRYDAESQEFSTYIFSFGGFKIVDRKSSMFMPNYARITFKASPSDAKEIKSNLRLKVVGFPVAPEYGRELHFFGTKFIVFDGQTNKIYAEIEGSKLNPNSAGNVDQPRTSTPASVTPSTVTPSNNGDVKVKGYYRRDGTYVRPHTRSRPRN